MSKTLRRPPVQGTTDPDVPGHVIVPVRKTTPGLPKVNYSVPDTSYFRVDTRTNRAVAVLTVTPDGVPLGWDSCGTCSLGIMACQCNSGLSLPSSIGYIYVSRGGIKPLPLPQSTRSTTTLVFQPPVATKRFLKREAGEERPKRLLRRARQDQQAEQEADRQVTAVLRKLKR